MSVHVQDQEVSSEATPQPLLRVTGLSVDYGEDDPNPRRTSGASRRVRAVDQVSFDLREGEVLGVIGESGSGKSTLGYALINLLPPPGQISQGEIWLDGLGDLAGIRELAWSRVRGSQIGMVFQGAQSLFNPLMTIGQQFADIFQAHRRPLASGIEDARRLLTQTRLDPDRVLSSYPHELSGGMRQRVAIVSSVMLHPKVLVLDEPTTALDAVSQAQVLAILRELRAQFSLSMILVTHDFAVASNVSDRVAVMYAGHLVEIGPSRALYRDPHHPYTQGLVAAVPSLVDTNSTRFPLLTGQPPDLRQLPPGCTFAPRCRFAEDICLAGRPTLEASGEAGRAVACVRWQDLPVQEEEGPDVHERA